MEPGASWPAGIALGRAEALVRAEAGSIRDRDGTAAALATAGSGRCGGLMSSTILHLVLMPAPYACFGKEGPEPDAKRAEIPA